MESTKTIIQLFKDSDEEKAFALLYDTYYYSLVTFSISIVEDSIVAEDIVQEFFVNFWLRKQYQQIDAGLEKYLFQSIKNNSLTWIRDSSRRIKILENIHKDSSPFTDQEREADSFEGLHRLINKMPEERRKVFQLIFMEEMSYQEVAKTLHISKNTVKTQVTRALKFLRENIKSKSALLNFILLLQKK